MLLNLLSTISIFAHFDSDYCLGSKHHGGGHEANDGVYNAAAAAVAAAAATSRHSRSRTRDAPTSIGLERSMKKCEFANDDRAESIKELS